jgi:hypothetical protein
MQGFAAMLGKNIGEQVIGKITEMVGARPVAANPQRGGPQLYEFTGHVSETGEPIFRGPALVVYRTEETASGKKKIVAERAVSSTQVMEDILDELEHISYLLEEQAQAGRKKRRKRGGLSVE